jgi:hypothetical protein
MGATEEEHQPSHQYTFLPNVTPKQQLLTALFDEHFISAYKAKLAIQSGALTTELTEHIKRVFVDASACFSEEIFGADPVETARVLVFLFFATKRFFTESISMAVPGRCSRYSPGAASETTSPRAAGGPSNRYASIFFQRGAARNSVKRGGGGSEVTLHWKGPEKDPTWDLLFTVDRH